MATTTVETGGRALDERLMKAADALLQPVKGQQAECLEVVYVGPGQRRVCRLIGRGKRRGSVRLSIWVMTPAGTTQPREGNHEVAFEHCEPTPRTLALLENAAVEWETREPVERVEAPVVRERQLFADAPIGSDTSEMGRTLEFIARVINQRGVRRQGRSGQFAGHSCEPAGRR